MGPMKKPLLLTLVAVGALALFLIIGPQRGVPSTYLSIGWVGGETRPILAANRYPAGMVRSTYAKAAEIPDILDHIYCYCFCERNHGHSSLRSCFATDHGAVCGICLSEANLVSRLAKAGKSIEEIQLAVDKAFARPG